MQRVGMTQALLEPVPTLARPSEPCPVRTDTNARDVLLCGAALIKISSADASKMRRFAPEGDRFRMQLRGG